MFDANGHVKQVLGPQGLAYVTVTSAYQYQIDFYYTNNVGGQTNGFYQPTAPSYVTFTFQNPDGGSANNRLFITENRGGAQRQFQTTFTAISNRWDLLEPDSQTTVSTWQAAVTGNSSLTNYFRQVTSNGNTLRLNQKTYQYVPGVTYLLLTQEIEGAGTLTNITTYTYYPTNAGTGANLVQRIDYPNGSFVYYVYDSLGRKTNEFSTFANNPSPPAGTVPNPITNNCKETDYAYTLSSSEDGVTDDDSIYITTPRRTIVSIPAQGALREISRTYDQVFELSEEVQQCPAPGSLWNASGNLRTITAYYSTGVTNVPGGSTRGKIQSISHPDGTAALYRYPDNYTTIEQTGEPDSFDYPTLIQDGTQTTTVVDGLGNVLTNTTASINLGTGVSITLAKDIYNYKDSNGNWLDPLERSYNLTDMAGRTTQYRYNDCCGLDHTVDPDGVTTTYIYDSNTKRLLGTTKTVSANASIERTNILDGLGRVLASMRVGSDGGVITLAQSQYDILGRQIQQTNGLGGVTTMTNFFDPTSGHTFTTNTYPDSGTRIEILNRDGQVANITGTAAFPLFYTYDIEQDSVSGFWRSCSLETKLDINGGTNEWSKSVF